MTASSYMGRAPFDGQKTSPIILQRQARPRPDTTPPTTAPPRAGPAPVQATPSVASHLWSSDRLEKVAWRAPACVERCASREQMCLGELTHSLDPDTSDSQYRRLLSRVSQKLLILRRPELSSKEIR
jgi:hypothetical protein